MSDHIDEADQAYEDGIIDGRKELEAELAEALHQVQQTQIDRDTWRSKYHEAAEKNAELHGWADSMLRKIEVLEAQNAELQHHLDNAI